MICCKQKKVSALLCLCMHVWFVWVHVQQQACVSLPTSPTPLSLTSIAISEAAVEAALFWQMLTVSKCISEDVMALVTLTHPLSLFLSISSLVFFTLTFSALPWPIHGFKYSILGPLLVVVLIYYSMCPALIFLTPVHIYVFLYDITVIYPYNS